MGYLVSMMRGSTQTHTCTLSCWLNRLQKPPRSRACPGRTGRMMLTARGSALWGQYCLPKPFSRALLFPLSLQRQSPPGSAQLKQALSSGPPAPRWLGDSSQPTVDRQKPQPPPAFLHFEQSHTLLAWVWAVASALLCTVASIVRMERRARL